jgi:hypothetical protein
MACGLFNATSRGSMVCGVFNGLRPVQCDFVATQEFVFSS